MLNNQALQQLSQLKNTIASQKETAEGVVRSTTKRFGFVLLDDGREAFIDPDQMQRLLPDDRIKVEIKTNAKDQLEATVDSLIKSTLKRFVGKYVAKGNNFFIEPDIFNFNRWLFVPPSDRTGLLEGDLVEAEIVRHPFKDGKAQVRVIQRIGREEEAGVEHRYTLAKFQLPNEFTPAAQNQASAINWSPLVFTGDEEDLTSLPFITIDSENTRDMDDAVYVTRTESGWQLVTAIADPTRQITIGTPLEQAARERASTVYLLGQAVTMLPTDLSHDTYSLIAGQKRPALLCRMEIDFSGQITQYSFSEGAIRSQFKLNYDAVANHLDGTKTLQDAGFAISDEVQTLIQELHNFAQARANWRQANALVMDEKPDYFFILNDQKKIDHVEKRDRNKAHRMIEEAMLCTNLCAGDLFTQNPGYGIFSGHIGFRTERIPEAISLITEDRPDLVEADVTTESLATQAGFQQLFKELRSNPTNNPKTAPLQSILQRMLQAGNLSFTPCAHFGLGVPAYAMVTSPIRRYTDLFNHLAIKALLNKLVSPLQEASEQDRENLLNQLQTQLNTGRQACRHLELWLCTQFMQQHINTLHQATIGLVNANGIGVKLDDLGVEAYALLVPKDGDVKGQFDSRRLSLTIGATTYRLDEKVWVMIEAVDVDKRKISASVVDEATAERLRAWM